MENFTHPVYVVADSMVEARPVPGTETAFAAAATAVESAIGRYEALCRDPSASEADIAAAAEAYLDAADANDVAVADMYPAKPYGATLAVVSDGQYQQLQKTHGTGELGFVTQYSPTEL